MRDFVRYRFRDFKVGGGNCADEMINNSPNSSQLLFHSLAAKIRANIVRSYLQFSIVVGPTDSRKRLG
jgi:hypothetical protein